MQSVFNQENLGTNFSREFWSRTFSAKEIDRGSQGLRGKKNLGKS